MLLHLRTSCSVPLTSSLLLQKPDLAYLKAMIFPPLEFTGSKQDHEGGCMPVSHSLINLLKLIRQSIDFWCHTAAKRTVVV